MKKIILFVALLLSIQGLLLAQEPIKNPFDLHPFSLGLGFGSSSGVGFNFRNLNAQGGWGATGILYYAPTEWDKNLLYSLGLSGFLGIANFEHTSNFNTYLYFNWGINSTGSQNLETGKGYLMLSTGPGMGLEILLLDHLSFTVELTVSGAMNIKDLSTPGILDWVIVTLPQLGLHYRF